MTIWKAGAIKADWQGFTNEITRNGVFLVSTHFLLKPFSCSSWFLQWPTFNKSTSWSFALTNLKFIGIILNLTLIQVVTVNDLNLSKVRLDVQNKEQLKRGLYKSGLTRKKPEDRSMHNFIYGHLLKIYISHTLDYSC